MDLSTRVQTEHKAWLERKYPGQPPHIPAAGCVEEAGELLHAALKLAQEGLWGPDPRHPGLRERLVDAVGDCCIYACSLCNSLDWPFTLPGWADYRDGDTVLTAARRVVLASLEASQVPYRRDNLTRYLATVCGVCELAGLSMGDCLERTWAKVVKR